MRHLLLYLILILFTTQAFGGDLRIVNIRVGQGDATLIQGPPDASGKRINILFDAGDIPELDGGNILRAVLAKQGVNKLDYVIVSHDDADHIGGIAEGGRHGKSFVLGFNGVVGCVGDDDGDGNKDWITGKKFVEPDPDELGTCDDMVVDHWVDYGEGNMRSTQAIKKYNGMANAMGTRITIADQETVDKFEIDLGNGAKMINFAANGYVRGMTGQIDKVDSPNEKSLSFLVTYGTFDFLISGDLIGRKFGPVEDAKVETAVAKAILATGRNVDIVHVNHHGAENASASEFLEMLKPNIAIISAGNGNKFKHPTNNVLRRLYDADIYRTIMTSFGRSEGRLENDVRNRVAVYQNDVIITSDGNEYEISTSRRYKTDKNYVPGNLQNLVHD